RGRRPPARRGREDGDGHTAGGRDVRSRDRRSKLRRAQERRRTVRAVPADDRRHTLTTNATPGVWSPRAARAGAAPTARVPPWGQPGGARTASRDDNEHWQETGRNEQA